MAPARKTTRKSSSAKKTPVRAAAKSPAGFSPLERSILLGKGMTEAQIRALLAAGVRSRADFATIGDAGTLSQLCGATSEAASAVIAWAVGARGSAVGQVIVESGDVVFCVACGKKQPKDYKPGDLCVHCGKQAEPVFSCYWCSASGPGKFCRSCGATFVSPGELELAILLKRDGLSKEEIPPKLASLPASDKEALWGRVRARR
jgi:hypothetical protein